MMGMEDLHASQEEQENKLVVDDMLNGGFYAMDEEEAAIEREIWLEGAEENIMDDVDVPGSASLFYNDFPPLPDFPCMSSSSSSSSSSTPAPTKAPISSSASSASSSSSAASWSMLRSDCEDAEKTAAAVPPVGSSASVDCMDVMENFEYMDLIDVSDLWDPSSIFNGESFEEEKILQQNQFVVEHREEERHLDELGTMFFEWLKTNKEHISAQDMRSIKLKRSTVESASKRLGSTKEGKKQLLKLILEWVEQYQLQKKGNGEPISQFPSQYLDPLPNPNPNPNLTSNSVLTDLNTCFPPPASWIPPPPYVADPAAILAASSAPAQALAPPGFYMADSYCNIGSSDMTNFNPKLGCHHYPPPLPGYQMIDSVAPASWPPSQFMMGSQYNQFPENVKTSIASDTMNMGFYGDNQYPYQLFGENGERLLRLGSSATKEARKKRMARQRRVNSSYHHSRHHHSHNNHQNHEQQQNQTDTNLRLGGENCGSNGQSNSGTWVYLPCGSAPPPGVSTVRMMPPATAAPALSPRAALKRTGVQGQNYHRQAAADRRQGWKQEKNLKFLLQKVLKQSDVGNLGRIVLPKKEAETHLPGLETRDGIAISMEDIGTSRVWNMRYRFWPNNKSRMYLLENTGEFVRANGLQEGDFVVIYSDIKCGKYLIRGVKVRQPGPKPEGKKAARRNQRSSAQAAANGTSSSPAKQNGK